MQQFMKREIEVLFVNGGRGRVGQGPLPLLMIIEVKVHQHYRVRRQFTSSF